MAISIRPQASAKPINVPISKETSSTTKKDYLMMFILILYSGVLKNNAKSIPELERSFSSQLHADLTQLYWYNKKNIWR
jgi:hypothetical protein